MCSCPGDCEGGPECLDDEGGPLAEPGRRPFAVCAPGMRPLIELALVLSGEQPMEVRETSLLDGAAAYIVTPPDFAALTPPLVFVPEPPSPPPYSAPYSALNRLALDRLAWASAVRPSYPLVLGSVV